MKLSVCTIGLRDRKADEAFRVMAECGYFHADCLAYSPTAHVNSSMSAEQRKAVVELAAKNGVKICSVAGGVGDKIASENGADREKAVKDIKADGEGGWDACIVGQGVIDFKACFVALKQAGFDGYLSLEYEAAEESKLGIEQSLAHIRRVLAEIA